MTRSGTTLAASAAALILAACGSSAPPAADDAVTIVRTAGGIPHVTAGDYESLGYGYGYVAARDNLCRLADFYLTVSGERSRYHDPQATYPFPANGFAPQNLNSDFFFKLIQAQGTVERLVAAAPPLGPGADVRALFRGHAAGYNRYLAELGAEAGANGVADPACRGAPWLRQISELDVYRMAYTLALFAGSAASVDGIGGAAPTLDAGPLDDFIAALADPASAASAIGDALRLPLASNAVAIGRDASRNGRGLLFGNPHQTWNDAGIFYQVHLTIPGVLDVSGTSFLGIPFVVIGTTRDLAWSHTTSSAFRFTPFQLLLAGTTSYLVDGVPEPMQAWPLEVQARTADGTLQTVQRTLHTTRYGPMVTNVAGLPLFVWTPVVGFALGDPNAGNVRYLNHFVEVNRAGSVRELREILVRNQGIPWANTVAADRGGETFYADLTVVANVDDAKAIGCGSVLGLATFPLIGLPVLDGARSACAWDTDADAVQPGIMGPSRLPQLLRTDYVANSNDSYWLANPHAPLTGYPRILGRENNEQRLRTRLGLTMIEAQRAAGGFDHETLQSWLYDGRNLLAEEWVDGLLSLCTAAPTLVGSGGPVDVGEACAVLAAWDRRETLDARGALLFRRIATRLRGVELPSGTTTRLRVPGTGAWLVPFRRAEPYATPRGLNPLHPSTGRAFADAVAELRGAGIALDAPLREYQFAERGGERIPLPGGLDDHGSYSIMNIEWDAARGYANPYHGNTYTQVVSWSESECPRLSTITAYSQSADASSPFHADQTRLYAEQRWLDVPFCAADVARQAIERIRLVRR